MLDKLKVALVLVVIGAISGFLIYFTNEQTYEVIAEKREEQEINFYKDIFSLDAEESITINEVLLENGMAEVEIIDSTSTVLGYVYKGSETNNYGDITVLVGIQLDGTIANVVISQSTNTPTFVKKIKDDYLNRLSGQEANELVLDTSTGASYTYGSVSKFSELATTYFVAQRGVNND